MIGLVKLRSGGRKAVTLKAKVSRKKDVKRTFLNAFLRGLGSASEVTRILSVPLAQESDLDKMRSDWTAIGNDFRTVIARENGKIAKQDR